jgi:hypothetical protein
MTMLGQAVCFTSFPTVPSLQRDEPNNNREDAECRHRVQERDVLHDCVVPLSQHNP